MRHVVIDFARRRAAAKRGAALRVSWPEGFEPAAHDGQLGPTVLALDAALDRLERECPRLAELVQLRFFGGLPISEIRCDASGRQRSHAQARLAARRGPSCSPSWAEDGSGEAGTALPGDFDRGSATLLTACPRAPSRW